MHAFLLKRFVGDLNAEMCEDKWSYPVHKILTFQRFGRGELIGSLYLILFLGKLISKLKLVTFRFLVEDTCDHTNAPPQAMCEVIGPKKPCAFSQGEKEKILPF